MPHWKTTGTWRCVAGQRGAQSPASLEPAAEPVFYKCFYSAFTNPKFDEELRRLGVDTLVVCGIYLEGCVRATVLDAYQRGYTVWVADDAVGSADPLHASISRSYLADRGIAFPTSQEIFHRLGMPIAPRTAECDLPVALVDGKWRAAKGHPLWERCNPSRWDEVLAEVPMAGIAEVESAAIAARDAQRGWRKTSLEARIKILQAWESALSRRAGELAKLLATEIGKPIQAGRMEITRALGHVRTTVTLAQTAPGLMHAGRARVRRCPLGVVGIITPWNNPVAIPVGKLAPALAFGNAVVWKPAPQAPRCALAVAESLLEAGFPPGLVNMVFGNADTAHQLVLHSHVDAISITGSSRTGRDVAAACVQLAKPVQTEMGGNNAAIITAHCDLAEIVPRLASAAFNFAGQRCTATRRFIAEESIRDVFTEAMVAATTAVRVGHPDDPATEVGPLVSREQQERVRSIVEEARAEGAKVLCGGSIPEAWQMGCWYAPTLMETDAPNTGIVRDETFGPVAVIQTARDPVEAIQLCNAVDQGLIATLYCNDTAVQERFLDKAQAGILRLNATDMEIDPAAPFGGWKASGFGPPEHGEGDWEFYTRPQTLYGPASAHFAAPYSL